MKRDPVREAMGLSRRRFLAASGWLAVGAAGLGLGQPVVADAAWFDGELVRVSSARTAMGTFVNMIVFHSSRDKADEAIEKAYGEIRRLEGLLSCHDDATAVGTLNREGTLRDMPPEMAELAVASSRFFRDSSGAFDITVKPVLDLYRRSFESTGAPPDSRRLENAVSRMGMNHVKLDGNGMSFAKEGMSLTFDGIGKGYIVDRAMAVLRKHGIKHGLVNAGGDICVTGTRGDGKPWRVAIQDPWSPGKLVDTIEMTHGAVATSGSYEIYFDREKQYHHLISPRQGAPAGGVAGVSIVAPDTMTADALSTSVFVLGTNDGRKLLRGTPGVRGLILSDRGRQASVNWSHRV